MTPQRGSKPLADEELGAPPTITMARNGLRAASPTSLPSLRAETVQLVAELAGMLTHLRMESGGHVIEVGWDQSGSGSAVGESAVSPLAAAGHQPAMTIESTPPTSAHHRVTAPLVGAFYRRPEPGVEPFAEVGDTVQEGQRLALIESMKLMNPVTADRAGVIVAFHAEDAEVVEFGQPLVEINTSGVSAGES